MPLQRAVERHALADEALAMIDQQPQIQLGAIQPGGRQLLNVLAQRGARDRERVDAVGLAALAPGATDVGHQLGRDAQHPLAAADQEALEGSRDVATVLQRPHALLAQTARPDH
jgi:hypothetical protein